MTWQGTAKYQTFVERHHVPERVRQAIALAEEFDFELSTHPHTGRLLAALAGGVVAGRIGETGTGTGVGLAWMHDAVDDDTELFSVEIDEPRARATAELFSDCPNVTVLVGDANRLAEVGPFDMLVLDSPCESGPLHYTELDPLQQLRPNGLVFKDDQWPMTTWPPTTFDGSPCAFRPHWFDHADMFTTEVQVADGYSVVLSRRKP